MAGGMGCCLEGGEFAGGCVCVGGGGGWDLRRGAAAKNVGGGGGALEMFAKFLGVSGRPSGPGRRAPSSPRHHRRRRRLCAARAEMGRFWGCRAKRLYVDLLKIS